MVEDIIGMFNFDLRSRVFFVEFGLRVYIWICINVCDVWIDNLFVINLLMVFWIGDGFWRFEYYG